MYELLRRTADRHASATAVMRGSNSATFGALLESSRRIAADLTRRDIRRFCIVDPDPIAVIPLLAAASLTGAETCVYPPTATPEAVRDMLDRFDHTLIVTPRDDLFHLCDTLTAAELQERPSESVDDSLPSARPHLVLTTGTTGAPRAARHDWWPLVRAIDLPTMRSVADQRWLLAYGMNQFGGLQILLHVVNIGATLVATEEFAPRAGLAAMRDHGVTHASATPTYWRFVLAELASDGGKPPDLRQITLGGEATSEQLLTALGTAFAGARITQIYGANEFGKNRSVRDTTTGLPLTTLTEDEDIQLKVEDGELWVKSAYAMRGYYGEEPMDPDAWRRTGDLVEVVGDRVLFRGRSSDVINVGGVKVHPLPVEDRISAIPGIDLVRVFGRPSALTGAVVAVEVVAAPDRDTDEIGDAIREACADLPPASRPRSIRFVDQIVTTDNKITRRAGSDRPEEDS